MIPSSASYNRVPQRNHRDAGRYTSQISTAGSRIWNLSNNTVDLQLYRSFESFLASLLLNALLSDLCDTAPTQYSDRKHRLGLQTRRAEHTPVDSMNSCNIRTLEHDFHRILRRNDALTIRRYDLSSSNGAVLAFERVSCSVLPQFRDHWLHNTRSIFFVRPVIPHLVDTNFVNNAFTERTSRSCLLCSRRLSQSDVQELHTSDKMSGSVAPPGGRREQG